MHRLIASWFGTGLILGRLRGDDRGSGTLGAFVALLMALSIGGDRWRWQIAATIVVIALSGWAAKPFASAGADPGWIVVDEAAGAFLAVIGLPLGPALAAFLVFRAADITKRFPLVAAAERLPGAIGITADDLAAGAWGLAAGWLLQSLL